MKILRKKEIKEINEKIKNEFNIDNFFDKKDKVTLDEDLISKNNEVVFFYHKNKLIPSIKLLQSNNLLPSITVDMGAVKFVISGADIMRPGITKVDKFDENSIVAIVDETHKKILAIGISSLNSNDLMNQKKGKFIKNIHYVGDNIYKI